jgi:hypothetical protein
MTPEVYIRIWEQVELKLRDGVLGRKTKKGLRAEEVRPRQEQKDADQPLLPALPGKEPGGQFLLGFRGRQGSARPDAVDREQHLCSRLFGNQEFGVPETGSRARSSARRSRNSRMADDVEG